MASPLNVALIALLSLTCLLLLSIAIAIGVASPDASRSRECVDRWAFAKPSSPRPVVRLASLTEGDACTSVPGCQWVPLTACEGACTSATQVNECVSGDSSVVCPQLKETVSCASSAPCVCSGDDLQKALPHSIGCAGNCDDALPGQQCQVKCPTGYQASGNPKVTCLGDGTWGIDTDWPFTCEPDQVRCPNVYGNLAMQTLLDRSTCVGARPNDECQIACHVGFGLRNNTNTLVCQSNGTWNLEPQSMCARQPCADCEFQSS